MRNNHLTFLLVVFFSLLLNCNNTKLQAFKLLEKTEVSEKTFIFHFSDVSINPVFELHQKTRNDIFSDFSQMKIIIDDMTKVFSIEDNCTFEYVIKKTSAVKYWGSSKTVELYKKELAGKNITLDENNVIVYQSLYPEKECQYPSSEFIKINKTLIFVYQGYLIFFRDNGNENNGKQNISPVIFQPILIKKI